MPEREVNILDIFDGLTRKQADRFRACVLAVLPPLREAVVEALKDDPNSLKKNPRKKQKGVK